MEESTCAECVASIVEQQQDWPWAKDETMFDNITPQTVKEKMCRKLKKAREEGNAGEARRIHVDRMLSRLYSWPWSSRTGVNLIDAIQLGKGFCTIKHFVPNGCRNDLRNGVLEVSRRLRHTETFSGEGTAWGQIGRIDVPVLDCLARNLFRPVPEERTRDASVRDEPFEGEERLHFLGDLFKRAFPDHHYAEAFVFRHRSELEGGQFKECEFHLDQPQPPRKINSEECMIHVMIPVDGRLPVDGWGVKKVGGLHRVEPFGAHSATGDVSFMGMKTWHRTGAPDVVGTKRRRTKLGSKKVLTVKEHLRLNVHLSPHKSWLLEHSKRVKGHQFSEGN